MTKGPKRGVFGWLDDRYSLGPLVDYMRHKEVPVHRHTIWYYMGGVTLFLFIVQLFTGILLLLYYRPGAESAYESVRFLMNKVPFGWLFRAVHNWGANLFILFAFVHMFSTYFTRAYAKPRELTWVTGFILLALGMGFGFSGYLLPWNELAFFATKVGTDIAGVLPIVGDGIKVFLRGGDDVTGATLIRFYAFHIALIPAIFTAFLGIHVLFVQRQGMHEPESVRSLPEGKRRMMAFFPNFMVRDLFVWLIVLNVLLFLAVFYPWELGLEADPFAPAPSGIKPEWYFMFMFQTLKLVPAHVLGIEGEVLGVLVFMVAGLAWMLVPFWEIRSRSTGKLKPMAVIGFLALAFIVIMTIVGYLV
jgi:cytochrome b6